MCDIAEVIILLYSTLETPIKDLTIDRPTPTTISKPYLTRQWMLPFSMAGHSDSLGKELSIPKKMMMKKKNKTLKFGTLALEWKP